MQKIYLDISNKYILPLVYAKQGEVGRKFSVYITENGVPYGISEKTFKVYYSAPSGDGNYEKIGEKSAFEIIDNNTVCVEIAPEVLVGYGEAKICLVMSNSDGSVIGLWNVDIDIECTPGFHSDPVGSYKPGLSAVLYVEQDLSEKEKEIARKNIGIDELTAGRGTKIFWPPFNGNPSNSSAPISVFPEEPVVGDYVISNHLYFYVVSKVENGYVYLSYRGRLKGEDGYSPVRGVDYWTDADKEEIKSYVEEGLVNGVSLIDRTTGKKYTVYVDNGKLTMTESE